MPGEGGVAVPPKMQERFPVESKPVEIFNFLPPLPVPDLFRELGKDWMGVYSAILGAIDYCYRGWKPLLQIGKIHLTLLYKRR
jgi:hypothetical protein